MKDLDQFFASKAESQRGFPRIKFHDIPLPERIQQFASFPISPLWQLSVGVVTQTVAPNGLKIIPTREVMFEIADLTTENHWTAFGIDPSSARVIATRLNEFADACESDWVTAPAARQVLPFRDPKLPTGA